MGSQRIDERVAVKRVVTFNTNIERAVTRRTRDAKDHIAIDQLAIVQRDLSLLVHGPMEQLGRTRDAPPVLAPVWEINILFAQTIKEWTAAIHLIGDAIPVRDRDRVCAHSQIS